MHSPTVNCTKPITAHVTSKRISFMQCIHPAQVAYLHKDFQMAYKSITLVKELLRAKDMAIMFWQSHPTHSYMVLLYRPLCSPWQHIVFTTAIHTCVCSPWQHTCMHAVSMSPWQYTCGNIYVHPGNIIRYRQVADVPWVLCCVILLWLPMCHCLRCNYIVYYMAMRMSILCC